MDFDVLWAVMFFERRIESAPHVRPAGELLHELPAPAQARFARWWNVDRHQDVESQLRAARIGYITRVPMGEDYGFIHGVFCRFYAVNINPEIPFSAVAETLAHEVGHTFWDDDSLAG